MLHICRVEFQVTRQSNYAIINPSKNVGSPAIQLDLSSLLKNPDILRDLNQLSQSVYIQRLFILNTKQNAKEHFQTEV